MVEPQEGMDVEVLMEVAELAERDGYGYFFRSDHLLPTSRSKGLDSSECWVTLGAMAQRTKKIKFGPMVSPIGWRNPALLARMACTVDAMAHGRLQLGLGAGWYQDEYLAHGFEFPDPGTRVKQFHEALEIIRPLTQPVGTAEFAGKHFSAHLGTLPKRARGIHLIVGGRTPSVVRQTATFGDEWNFFTPFPEKFDSMKAALEGSGREIEISRMGPFVVAESEAKLRARLRGEMRKKGATGDEDAYARTLKKGGWLVGVTDDFVSSVNELRERGVDKFYFQLWDPAEREQIDFLAGVLKGM
jgi:alkanesulfonate monooxygenase SsuD/methylene tetrahydromethanopterin reductase-like flavin-dependent oxidoreductase (luciferase family)